MTYRGLQVLQEIQRALATQHYPPTIRELGEACGLSSPSTVHTHLHNLEREGLIEQVAGKRRTLRITLLGKSALREAELAA